MLKSQESNGFHSARLFLLSLVFFQFFLMIPKIGAIIKPKKRKMIKTREFRFGDEERRLIEN